MTQMNFTGCLAPSRQVSSSPMVLVQNAFREAYILDGIGRDRDMSQGLN